MGLKEKIQRRVHLAHKAERALAELQAALKEESGADVDQEGLAILHAAEGQSRWLWGGVR